MSDASTVSGASELMRDLWPQAIGSVSERIRAAHVSLRWSYSRTRDLWYGAARRIDGSETVRLLEERMKREAKTNKNLEEMANEHWELTKRLDRMEAMLSALVSHVAGSEASNHQPRPR